MPGSPKFEFEPLERFSILVLYEDTFTHNRVREFCDRLLDQYWGQWEFDLNWWSFRSLKNPATAGLAATVATEVHLVIVSAHAGDGLPAHIRSWMERWTAARKPAEGALAALVGLPQEQGAVPIINFLQQMAQRARMDFLPNAAASGVAAKPRPLSRREMVTEDLRRMFDPHRPPPHWGINE